ncbi:hypothetical protein NW762_013714 [Fusarium torreyae]|uniref:Dienelactone hydrolase domain-containing protein n=1 Tax=Fusarium torreyae TaxID=1237075 RepID=A0A9W8V9Z6_9HYPO|nr:hypothetical protein NW762_013714 [Fusarium torreyae]
MSCPDCVKGSIHEGEPRGREIKLHGLDSYVVEPQGRDVRGIIVVLPDAFGWKFVNTRLLADNYANKSHYKIYLPDLMIGDAVPISMLELSRVISSPGNLLTRGYTLLVALWVMIPFVIRNRFGQTSPIVRGFFEQLQKEEGANLPVGAAGFCWGGKHAFLLAHGTKVNSEPLIDAAFVGHPGALSLPSDAQKVILPVSVAVGDNDFQLSEENAKKMRTVLEGKPEGMKGEVKIYPGMGHGFCLRAAPEKDVADRAVEAEDQCITWFDTHFERIN